MPMTLATSFSLRSRSAKLRKVDEAYREARPDIVQFGPTATAGYMKETFWAS